MTELKEIVLNENFNIGKGDYKLIKEFNNKYINELSKNKIKKKIKASCSLWKWNSRYICSRIS